MKRTGEITLTIIAGAMNCLALITGIRLMSADLNAIRDQLLASQSGKQLSEKDIDAGLQFIHGLGTTLVVVSVICVILAIIALIFLFKRIKRMPTAILLIAATVISLPEIFPAIFYLIAGIMMFVRKPPVTGPEGTNL